MYSTSRQIKVFHHDTLLSWYSNVKGESNIDGTLRIWGLDEDGEWTATYPPDTWTRIEEIL